MAGVHSLINDRSLSIDNQGNDALVVQPIKKLLGRILMTKLINITNPLIIFITLIKWNITSWRNLTTCSRLILHTVYIYSSPCPTSTKMIGLLKRMTHSYHVSDSKTICVCIKYSQQSSYSLAAIGRRIINTHQEIFAQHPS